MEEMQGVMALPEMQGMGMSPEDMQVLQQIRQNIPRQEVTQEFLSAGEQIDPQAVAAFKEELAALDLDKQSLDELNAMVDTILAAPQDYASLRRAYLEEGFPEEVLPEQFDPGFFAALNMAIDVMIMNQGSRPPMAMAQGGIADLAAYGRNGDTMLAHITPQEAALLKRMGGSGTINPATGLPEFFVKWAAKKIKGAVKSIGNAVKKFAQSTVGKVIIGAGLAIFGGPLAAGFLSGVAGSAGLSTLSSFLVSKVGMAAVGGFLAGAGTTLASGGNLKQALRAGAIGAVGAGAFTGVTGAIQGASTADLFSAPAIAGTPPPNVAAPIDNLTTPPPLNKALSGSGVGSAADLAAGPEMGFGEFNNPAPSVEVSAPLAPRAGTLSASMDFPPAPISGDTLTASDRAIPAQPTGPRAPTERALSLYQTAIDVPPNQSFPPSIGDVGQTPSGGGLMNTLREGYGKVENFYDKYISPNRYLDDPDVLKAQQAAAATARENAIKQGLSPAGVDRAIERAVANATPGVIARYAPLAGLGVAGLAASGAFSTKRPDVPKPEIFSGPTGYEKYFMYPSTYGLNFGGTRPTSFGSMYTPTGYAEGGGVMDTPQAMRVGGKTYPRKVGAINGPGTGTSDSIPAMLSDGEFVFTAKAVRAMGNGSRRKGAKKMYQLMKMLEGKAA